MRVVEFLKSLFPVPEDRRELDIRRERREREIERQRSLMYLEQKQDVQQRRQHNA